MNKDEKIANINIRIKDFFFKWIEFTRPLHKLNKQQQVLLSLLLYRHYELSKEITNNKILWKEVFDYDTKVLISDEMGIQIGSIENLLSSLRKSKVIMDNQINKNYVPDIDKKTKQFKLIFNFRLIYEENPRRESKSINS